MLVDGLVMAAGVAAAALVTLSGTLPARHGGEGFARPGAVDAIAIVLFALAGSFAFGVLARAGG